MSGFGENAQFTGFEPITDSDLIPIEAEISSPDRGVLNAMKEGDIFKVALRLSGDATVVVVMHKGQTAGEIVSPLVQKLPEYIVRGTDYTATLTSKDDGRFIVRIRAIE